MGNVHSTSEQNVNALVASLCSHKALRVGLAITPCSGYCALTWVPLRELASKISGLFIQSTHAIG